MGRDWQSELKADPTEWLLGSDNPAVRFYTLRDILDYPRDDPVLKEAKEAIRNWNKVKQILNKQSSTGYWESEVEPYIPKYKATYWQIIILSLLGLDKEHEAVKRACNTIWGFQHRDGGFCSIKEDAALKEYIRLKERWTKKGKPPIPYLDWAPEAIRESEMTCLTGNICAALIRLGYAEDDRVKSALDWLVAVQNSDGGWLCPYWKAHINDTHSCFMGTIAPLDAFATIPEDIRTPRIWNVGTFGSEFLLMHRLFKADHHDFGIINESWLKLGFPQFSYDILRGLDVVTRLEYLHDDRLSDTLLILKRKQNNDGTWILESTPTGRMQTAIEQKGKPSKWITLYALRVLKRIYRN
jgi:hypothetical protein